MHCFGVRIIISRVKSSTLIMVNITGCVINEMPTLNALRILLWLHFIYQFTLLSIIGLRSNRWCLFSNLARSYIQVIYLVQSLVLFKKTPSRFLTLSNLDGNGHSTSSCMYLHQTPLCQIWCLLLQFMDLESEFMLFGYAFSIALISHLICN